MPGNLIVQSSLEKNDSGVDTLFTKPVPLPHLTPSTDSTTTSSVSTPQKQYEVVVIGAGPAGLMLTTLLTRYGLPASSVLSVDKRAHQTPTGNADGLNPRTLEILGTLGLEARVRREGNVIAGLSRWNRDPSNPNDFKRFMRLPWMLPRARFEHLIAYHQGRVETLFREDIVKHGGADVQYSSSLVDVKIDEVGSTEYPVVATIQKPDGSTETVRTKYLVGADGARSAVRDIMGVETEGEKTDELWGVIDLVADTDFPDIRRLTNINASMDSIDSRDSSSAGFVVPREKTSSGNHLTRVYLDLSVKAPSSETVSEDQAAAEQHQTSNERRSQITKEFILERAKSLFHPYRFDVRKDTEVEWWAAFQISQRLSKSFSWKDSTAHPRIFIVGDACHAHSPRQGQGMNVSIHDAHNLAWKLAYAVLGLAGPELLDTYEDERLPNARELVAFDRRMNQEQRTVQEMMLDLRQFSGSCGVEYGEGMCVNRGIAASYKDLTSEDYVEGVIYPGRRLINSTVKRYVDDVARDIHDEVGGDGRFAVVALLGNDFAAGDGQPAKTAKALCDLVASSEFPAGLVRPLIVYPESSAPFEWTDIPAEIKEQAEMNLYYAPSDVYKLYGIPETGDGAGALVVVRPDGFVGTLAKSDDINAVSEYLKGVLKSR